MIRERRETSRSGGRALLRDRRGAMMLEFILAFVPVFVLFLGIAQLALLAAAEIVVRHAAILGARAASVVLDDDPRRYGGTPRMRTDGAPDLDPPDLRIAAALGAAGAAQRMSRRPDGPRMAAIRAAVHTPLAAIAPARALLDRPSAAHLAPAIRTAGNRLAAGLAYFVPVATSVVLARTPGSGELHDALVTGESVVLRVSHVVPCAMPIARALLCRSIAWDARAQRLVIAGADERTQRALQDLKRAPGARHQAALLDGTRVHVVTAEARMPLHAAPYAYRGELEP